MSNHEDNINSILQDKNLSEEPLRLASKSLKNVLLNNKFSIEDANLLEQAFIDVQLPQNESYDD